MTFFESEGRGSILFERANEHKRLRIERSGGDDDGVTTGSEGTVQATADFTKLYAVVADPAASFWRPNRNRSMAV